VFKLLYVAYRMKVGWSLSNSMTATDTRCAAFEESQ